MKTKTFFECQACGHQSPKWLGRCPDCGDWNSFQEEKLHKESSSSSTRSGFGIKDLKSKRAQNLNEIESESIARAPIGIPELDRVFGGGIVPGSLVLVGGDPGIGKSTLLLQLGLQVSKNETVLYVSGEESPNQVKLRADRITQKKRPDQFLVYSETHFERILEEVRSRQPSFLVIDSIQTVYTETLNSAPGSVSQVREVSSLLMNLAKANGITIFIIGHVTKEGSIAGPRVLEHIVDTVLVFEGDQKQSYRILRVTKNRFGSTQEIGVFEMDESGLIPVDNPSQLFLSDRYSHCSGTAIAAPLEGTRPLLVEVQALVAPTTFAYPKRTCLGVDQNKVALLMAVIEKKLGIHILDQDVFIKVVGGLKLSEPASDLAIVLSLLSSLKNLSLKSDWIFIGEVGLTGEIRKVPQIEKRLIEASRLGFTGALIPKLPKKSKPLKLKGMEVHEISHLRQIDNFEIYETEDPEEAIFQSRNSSKNPTSDFQI